MSDHDFEALDRISREVRDQEPPDVDWDRVENRLFAQIDAEERPRSTFGRGRLVALFAAAAAIALLFAWSRQPKQEELASAPVPAVQGPKVYGPELSRLDGSKLVTGDEVVAGAQSLLVEHAGRASWTLEPGSRATIGTTGEILTLRLTSGTIGAQVVPSPKPETFVVEVDAARVAVHGTAFRVARGDSDLRVEVREGVVAVGARTERASYFLHAGDSGSFSKDGKTGEVKRAATAAAEPAAAPGKAPIAVRPALPPEPTSLELGKAVDQIAQSAATCFEQHAAKGEVRVQVQTELSVTFGGDGKVQSIAFAPQLAPAISECVEREAAKVKVPESTKGGTGRRSLLLGS
ncbi:MAG: FecR family protein [Polyangiaceae bacterium]